MTETAIIEAVRGAGGVQPAGPIEAAATVADPSAVARFEAALAPSAPMEIPFAGQVAATFNAAQGNYQEILHRVHGLTSMARTQSLSAAELSTLQYEVSNLAFQQEIVTNIAKKASDAVSTLVKNG